MAPVSASCGLRNEAQRHAIVAIALSGRRRPVIEHVAVVAAAAGAVVFGAREDELEVGLVAEGARDGREKTRPAGAAVELHRGTEQRQGAARTNENARTFLMVERAAAGRLGSLLAQHVVRGAAQPLPPFVVRKGSGSALFAISAPGASRLFQSA